MNHGEIVSFIWGVADLIRDTFKRGKYQDVILPLTILRRLDCVLAPTKERVLKRQAELRGKGLQDLDAQLRKASGFAFYNTSRYDFDKLLADSPHIAPNLRNYIAGFSPNMREVLEKFDFDNTISKLTEAGLLFQVLERFKKKPIARVQVTIKDLGPGLKGVTDEDGHFAFTDVPAGKHKVELSNPKLVTQTTEEEIVFGKKKTVKRGTPPDAGNAIDTQGKPKP